MPLWPAVFDPPVKIDGRYYGFPSTDKQKIDLNVNPRKIVNILSAMHPEGQDLANDSSECVELWILLTGMEDGSDLN
jgi:hypothetical protein